MTTYLAAAIQMDTGADVAVNLGTAASLIAEAARHGAKLAVLPETMNYLGRDFAAKAEAVPGGRTCRRLAELARQHRMWLCGGSIYERNAQDSARPFNTAFVISPEGECTASYSKLHPFDVVLPSGVTSRETDQAMAGGVVGCLQTGGRVRSCVAAGKVKALQGRWVGGVAGALLSGGMTGCVALGKAEGREAGALIGFSDRRAQVILCRYPAGSQRAVPMPFRMTSPRSRRADVSAMARSTQPICRSCQMTGMPAIRFRLVSMVSVSFPRRFACAYRYLAPSAAFFDKQCLPAADVFS